MAKFDKQGKEINNLGAQLEALDSKVDLLAESVVAANKKLDDLSGDLSVKSVIEDIEHEYGMSFKELISTLYSSQKSVIQKANA